MRLRRFSVLGHEQNLAEWVIGGDFAQTEYYKISHYTDFIKANVELFAAVPQEFSWAKDQTSGLLMDADMSFRNYYV